MKKLILTLVVSALVAVTVPALAAKGSSAAILRDKATLTQLSALEARKSMLTLCGVTGEEADKALAPDNEKAAKLQAALSDEGKKTLPDTLAKIDAGVKASWEKTPEDARAKSCDAW